MEMDKRLAEHAMMSAPCRGLPTAVLRELLQDIEDNGGLNENLRLKSLCAKKPDVYGLPASARRRAIQNKTQRLKKMSRVAYLELLVSMRISTLPLQRHPYTAAATGDRHGRTGIQPHQFHVLLQDIESQGGLQQTPSLRTLCNRKPELFGLPGSKERRVIQNKMHHLKLLGREDYLELLVTMGIHTPLSNATQRAG